MDRFTNPLDAVQLIPIFSYLNILSDFLFIENYLSETDQNKPIPIINGLYKYLEDNENNKIKKCQLIRNLLKGSDLYGAQNLEYFDVTFVNVMFDYIISSLVFEKYGNIYGFLAKIFGQLENLQLDEVLNVIIVKLENESFENEYGEKSILSLLAVNRIYNDIILPLFPRPKSDLGVLSLDYIYAQAGCMFLRAGRINNTYYTDFPNIEENQTDENLFDQYLITGHLIERLIRTEEKNLQLVKSFALPALLHYVSCLKFVFTDENMAKTIAKPDFWQMVYNHLFQHTTVAFNDTENKLQNDYKFKMHMALFNFQSCNNLRELDREEYFKNQIKSITELYEKYYFQLIQNAVSVYLIERFEFNNVVIKLLVPNNVDGDYFIKSKYLSLDLLQISTSKTYKHEYYILNNENYNVTISNEDWSENYTVDVSSDFLKLKNSCTLVVLKASNDNMTVFFQNIAKYKKERLETVLNSLANCQARDRQLKVNWWKEFGLSLVPNSPCLTPTLGTNYREICTPVGNDFFYRHSNHTSLKTINIDTQHFLSHLGTTIKSFVLRNEISKIVDGILPKNNYTSDLIIYALSRKNIFNDITLHLNDPSFQLSCTTNEEISLLQRIINNITQKTRLSFTSVTGYLSKITNLKSNYFRSVGTIGVNGSRLIFVNTLNNRSDTGYGYKFVFLSRNVSEIAQLRTGYEIKDVRLLKIEHTAKEGKTYVGLNNMTFEPETDHRMYEINNQLRRRPTKVLFSGLSIQLDDLDENCKDIDYFQEWKGENRCRRQQRFREESDKEEEAVKYIRNKTGLSEEKIHSTLGRYMFPDNAFLTLFVNNWIKKCCFEEPTASEDYVIINSDHLKKLRYHLQFENIIKPHDGEFRINLFYSKVERHKIEEEASLKSIVESYNEQKARFSVTFHDYYAIRNYVTTGYTRISGDTNEAKLMQLALYNLAIRQSDDPDDTFDLKLFRVETKPTSFLEILFPNKLITLEKFTQAYPNVAAAMRFSGYPLPGFVNIVYEMVFNGPYPRAKIEQFYREKEMNVILLPGSEFRIVNSAKLNIGGLGRVVKLTLNYQHTFKEKYVWFRTIMDRISKINI